MKKLFLPLSLLFSLVFNIHISSQDCVITNVLAEAHDCDSTGLFFVDIEFEYDEVGNDGFVIRGNGVVYDTFEYGQIFYTVGPLEADCSTLYEFVVIDLATPTCSGFYAFDFPFCCPPFDCSITVDDIIAMDCDTSGFREVKFSLIANNVGPDGFDILYNGIVINHFAYGFNSYSINLPGDGQVYELLIQDSNTPGCFTIMEVQVPACLNAPVCNGSNGDDLIFDLGVCTSDSTYSGLIKFTYTGQDDSLWVYLQGEMPFLIPVKGFPISLLSLSTDVEVYEFFVHEQDNVFCSFSVDWESPDCSSFSDCSITEVFAELHECNDSSNMVLVDVGFNVNNPDSDSFVIRGNGIMYDTFEYGQLFYTVGPIDVNCDQHFEFVVVDLENEDCLGEFVFDSPPCCDCSIHDINVDPGNCTGDGEYSLFVDFEYENVTNNFFDVYSNGQFVGFYAYNDLPITINNFPERDAEYDIIMICDNANPDCCSVLEFMGPDCIEETCEIFNVFAEESNCNDEDEVFITIEFDFDNPGTMGFQILGNGTNYGTYDYGQINYIIGPLPGDCETIYEFVVQDVQFPDCSDFFEFVAPICCDDSLCEISNIIVVPLECTGDGLYSLWLNFNYENTGDVFTVHSQGQFLGSFLYDNLPVLINDVPERDVEYDIITVCDSNNPDCCQTIEFMGLDCMEMEEECSISNISVDPITCTGNGYYSIWLEFDFEFPGNDFYEVYSGSNYVGIYPFTSVPIIIDSFPERDAEYDLITVCVNDNELCCAQLEFMGLDCEDSFQCSISNIEVDPGQCTGDGFYSLVLDFNYENVGNDFFEVFSGNTFLGFFSFNDLPITINEFPEREAEYDIITVCVNDMPDCCGTLEFLGSDCFEEEICLIFDLTIDPVECTGDSSYSLWLDFEYENVTNDFFDVFSDGEFVGFYSYNDLPVFIENFPSREEDFDFIVICDNDNPACCSGYEFLGLDCSGSSDCQISEVFAETHPCSQDGTVLVDIEFNVENPGSQGFIVRGNGVVYDTFDYGQVFYTVGPIIGDCETLYEFIVIDIENPDCAGEFNFDNEICCDMGTCAIFDAQGELHECSDSFDLVLVDIWFEVNSPGSEGFTVRGNGVVYDTFDYGENFYTIGPIEADCETTYEFILTDLEFPDCSDFFFFEDPVCCGDDVPCSIESIDILDADCVNNDIYVIELDVEHVGTGDLGFDLYINEVFHSFHLYENLPVTIEVSKDDFESPFNITVCENDSEGCCNTIAFEFTDVSTIFTLPDNLISTTVTDDFILIESDIQEELMLNLFSIDGRLQYKEKFNDSHRVGTENLISGIYILLIESVQGIYTKKIMVLH